jgi:hypothetical protein
MAFSNYLRRREVRVSDSAGSGISTWLVRKQVPFRHFVLFSEDETLWLGLNRLSRLRSWLRIGIRAISCAF